MSVQILSVAQKKEIYRLFKTSGQSKAGLGRQYGVSEKTIRRVIKELDGSGKVAKPKAKVKKPVAKPVNEAKWIKGSTFITVVYNNQSYTANKEHVHFDQIIQAMKDSDVDAAIALINIKKTIQTKFGDIEVKNKKLFYKNIHIQNGLANRIVKGVGNEEDVTKLTVFLEALLQTPSASVLSRLFEFLEHNDIEITDDGHFIAYKRVTSEYLDFYTKTISNKIGEVVSVPRNQVDENQNITCSFGLHVAAKTYLKSYHGGSGVIIACKVHPKDVVAIPADYNNSKMRVCEYFVLNTLNETH